jgi:hypothetical protein
MFALGRMAGSVVICAALSTGVGQRVESEPDVFARRGVYVEADRGIVELRQYAEGRSVSDSVMKAYRYRIDPNSAIPRVGTVISFIVNEPGNRADAWMAGTQVLLVVGQDVDVTGSNYFQMTARVTKLRASVYQIMSPEFQGSWIRSSYDKALLKMPPSAEPRAGYVGVLLQEWTGQPRRLYPVQVLP